MRFESSLFSVSLILILFFFSCNLSSRESVDLFKIWNNRIVKFPCKSDFYLQTEHLSESLLRDKCYLILSYTDSLGCQSCNMMLDAWATFISEVCDISDNRVGVLNYVCPRNSKDIIYELVTKDFPYPVCIDLNDSLNKLNHFPSDPRFHCFLLDENNKVILIGNPVQNPKIKELYLRTISERLGIEYNQNSDAKMDSKNEINLGSFPKSESKSVQFFIPNNTESEMQIDTVFTSCECTTASIDKIVVPPSSSANLTVKYTPDVVGEFYREVYVQIKGEDKPLVYKIRGKVE